MFCYGIFVRQHHGNAALCVCRVILIELVFCNHQHGAALCGLYRSAKASYAASDDQNVGKHVRKCPAVKGGKIFFLILMFLLHGMNSIFIKGVCQRKPECHSNKVKNPSA